MQIKCDMCDWIGAEDDADHIEERHGMPGPLCEIILTCPQCGSPNLSDVYCEPPAWLEEA